MYVRYIPIAIGEKFKFITLCHVFVIRIFNVCNDGQKVKFKEPLNGGHQLVKAGATIRFFGVDYKAPARRSS